MLNKIRFTHQNLKDTFKGYMDFMNNFLGFQDVHHLWHVTCQVGCPPSTKQVVACVGQQSPVIAWLVWLVWFYGISTIVGYLMQNSFLYIQTVLFWTIQFSIRTVFCLHIVKCTKAPLVV